MSFHHNLAYQFSHSTSVKRSSLSRILYNPSYKFSKDNASYTFIENLRIGLLTRTTIPSPAVKWIFPCQFFTKDETALVGVGENFIIVKHLTSYGRLETVATREFNHVVIRSAVIHQNFEPFINVARSNSPLSCFLLLTLSSGHLLLVWGSSALKKYELHLKYWSLPASSFESLLESSLYLSADPFGRAFSISLDDSILLFNLPKYRPETNEPLYLTPKTLLSYCDIKKLDFTPTLFTTEFLHPYEPEVNRVVFLVLHFKDGLLCLSCFSWLFEMAFQSFTNCVNALILLDPTRIPLFIIPTPHLPSCIFIYEDTKVLLSGILEENTLLNPIETVQFPNDTSSRELIPSLSLWVGWSPARLTSNFDKPEFYLFCENGSVVLFKLLSREQAHETHLFNLECSIGLEAKCFPGKLNGNKVDFLITTGSMSDGALYSIFYDNIFDPTLKITKPSSSSYMLQRILNWWPTLDFEFSNHAASYRYAENDHLSFIPARKRLFCTAGREPHGAITELRLGMKAEIEMIYRDSLFHGVSEIFCLADNFKSLRFCQILVSLVWKSMLMVTSIDDSTAISYESSTKSGFNLSFPTIYSTRVAKNFALQITTHAVYLVKYSRDQIESQVCWHLTVPGNGVYTHADFHTQYLLVAYKTLGETAAYLIIYRLINCLDGNYALETCYSPLKLSGEVTCLAISDVGNHPLLAVAKFNGEFEMYAGGASSQLIPMWETSFQNPIGKKYLTVAECVKILRTTINTNSDKVIVWIIAGLRSGDLYFKEVFVSVDRYEISNIDLSSPRAGFVPVGNSPIKLKLHPNGERLYGHCESIVFRVEFEQFKKFQISEVWLTDIARSEVPQSFIFALDILSDDSGTDHIKLDTVACVIEGQISVTRVENCVSTVPRSISVPGTPQRFLFIEKFQVMLLVTDVLHPNAKSTASKGMEPKLRSIIYAIYTEPSYDWCNSSLAERTFDELVLGSYEFKAGERVNSISEWKHELDTLDRNFILIGTQVSGNRMDGKTDSGRFLIVQLIYTEDGIKFELIFNFSVIEPVCEVTPFLCNSFVFGHGGTLMYFELDLPNFNIRNLTSEEFKSPIVHISTLGSLIFVSTAMHSTIALSVTNQKSKPNQRNKLMGLRRFTFEICDCQPRDATFHSVIKLPQLDVTESQRNAEVAGSLIEARVGEALEFIIIADKTGELTGLVYNAVNMIEERVVSLAFCAKLSRSMMRVRRGNFLPLWSRCGAYIFVDGEPIKGFSLEGIKQKAKPIDLGVLDEDLVAISSDGCVMSLLLIDEVAWRMLKFLERICIEVTYLEMKEAERIGRGDTNGMTLPTRLLKLNPEADRFLLLKRTAYHVKCDMLKPLFESEGEQFLVAALNRVLVVKVESGGVSSDSREEIFESTSTSGQQNTNFELNSEESLRLGQYDEVDDNITEIGTEIPNEILKVVPQLTIRDNRINLFRKFSQPIVERLFNLQVNPNAQFIAEKAELSELVRIVLAWVRSVCLVCPG